MTAIPLALDNGQFTHAGTKTTGTTRLALQKTRLTDAEMMFSNWTSDDKVTLQRIWFSNGL